MKKSELKQLIREVITELRDDSSALKVLGFSLDGSDEENKYYKQTDSMNGTEHLLTYNKRSRLYTCDYVYARDIDRLFKNKPFHFVQEYFTSGPS